MIRRRVLFSGRVQGVGFRYTTEGIARSHKVLGFVRNLPDGRVELVAEGLQEELDRFLNALKARMSGNIDEAKSAELAATGEFSAFRIAM